MVLRQCDKGQFFNNIYRVRNINANPHSAWRGLFLVSFETGVQSCTKVLSFPWQGGMLLERSLGEAIQFFSH